MPSHGSHEAARKSVTRLAASSFNERPASEIEKAHNRLRRTQTPVVVENRSDVSEAKSVNLLSRDITSDL